MGKHSSLISSGRMSIMKAMVAAALIGAAVAMQPLTQVSVTPDDVPSDQCGVSAILNDDERMELFALGYDGEIHHKWQNYDGTWSNWVGLGGNFSSGASVVRNIDGRVEVFALGKDDMLYHPPAPRRQHPRALPRLRQADLPQGQAGRRQGHPRVVRLEPARQR